MLKRNESGRAISRTIWTLVYMVTFGAALWVYLSWMLGRHLSLASLAPGVGREMAYEALKTWQGIYVLRHNRGVWVPWRSVVGSFGGTFPWLGEVTIELMWCRQSAWWKWIPSSSSSSSTGECCWMLRRSWFGWVDNDLLQFVMVVAQMITLLVESGIVSIENHGIWKIFIKSSLKYLLKTFKIYVFNYTHYIWYKI